MRRQIIQSIVQFLSVFLTGIAVYKGFPTKLDQIYQPLIQGLLAALAIWGGSKLHIGETPRAGQQRSGSV
jgi:hypothetical protein